MLVPEVPIKYIDKLQKQNAEDLAFYPLSALREAVETKHVIACEENGEPAGYLWFGAVRAGKDISIFQACVDYDLRRQHLGFEMLAELTKIGMEGACTGIKLTCASSAEANRFWQVAGFYCILVKPGGIKRGRDLNVYRTDLIPLIFPYEKVEPSSKPIDEKPYRAMKRRGIIMPNRFSRDHY